MEHVFEKYGKEAFYFPFHNSKYDPEDLDPRIRTFGLYMVDYPFVEDFMEYKGFALEIPAIWKPSRNKRLWQYASESVKNGEDPYKGMDEFVRQRLEQTGTPQEGIADKIEKFTRDVRNSLQTLMDQYGYDTTEDYAIRQKASVANIPLNIEYGLAGDAMIERLCLIIRAYITFY